MVNGKKEMMFNGPSPDEVTLVDFAKNNGLMIYQTSDTEYIVKVFSDSGLLQNDANKQENLKGDED